jgi:hypothetical protein
MMIGMTDHDPAFLWETEALRTSPQRVTETEIDIDFRAEEAVPEEPLRWCTLRDASRATGIPVETLRKWARRSTIPSYLTPTSAGTNVRMVDLEGVKQRATELGRAIRSEETLIEQPIPPQQSPQRQTSTLPVNETTVPAPAELAPAGTMIVPIDAWNKMLNQLGNLHEAGQQLAIASERAAKAETEAKFLRERLAELRREPISQTFEPTAADQAEPAPASNPEPTSAPPEKVWQYLIRRVRDRGPG